MKHIKTHAMYHISLLFILCMGVIMGLSTSHRQTQMLVITFTAFLYVGWGILHHLLNHDLRAKIVVEYVLMAMLGITIAVFFI